MGQPVVHFEICGRDGAKLHAYYAELFGWKIDANNPMNYGMVHNEQGIGGGVGQGDKPSLTFYIEVPDPAAALKQAEAAGAKVVMPVMDVPGGPTIAQFSDPEGNVVGIMKPMAG